MALLHDGCVDLLCESAVHGHSERVLPMVDGLLQRRGLRLRDCDGVGFGAGPGAFTGLRIACGVAQGLAFGAGLPVLPVDCVVATALCARALAGAGDDIPVAVALDARMGEVYFALVDAPPPGVAVARLAAPAEAAAGLMAEIDAACVGGSRPIIAAGDGFARHPDAFVAMLARLQPAGVHVPAHARADAIARLAALAFVAGLAVPPDDAFPFYVRDKVALDVDEQRAARLARAAAALDRAQP